MLNVSAANDLVNFNRSPPQRGNTSAAIAGSGEYTYIIPTIGKIGAQGPRPENPVFPVFWRIFRLFGQFWGPQASWGPWLLPRKVWGQTVAVHPDSRQI